MANQSSMQSVTFSTGEPLDAGKLNKLDANIKSLNEQLGGLNNQLGDSKAYATAAGQFELKGLKSGLNGPFTIPELAAVETAAKQNKIVVTGSVSSKLNKGEHITLFFLGDGTGKNITVHASFTTTVKDPRPIRINWHATYQLP